MREKHSLGRRLLALTAAACTLGSLTVAPMANAEQASPTQPEAQQQAPQADNADGTQQLEADAKPENTGKPVNGSTQERLGVDAGSADAEAQGGVPINEYHFPDAKFREYVGRFDTVSLNGSAQPDRYLSQGELDKVTSIQLGGMDTSTWQQLGPVWDLKSVKGVEYFRNLASLNLQTTGITELDMSGNPRLEKLYLGACLHLTKLNITRNAKLREIDVTAAGLSSLDLPSGDDQLTFVSEISDETRPRLLAVRGATFKDFHNDPFVSGRTVVGDSLDLVTATGFTADELRGHILLVKDGWWLDDGKAGTKPFDGTVLRPEDGSSYMTYLYFPRLGDREKWMENPTGSKAPFMLVHLGFLDSAEHQEWRGLVEVDPSEFTPASWSTAEENWEHMYDDLGANYGYERSKQGFLDVLINVQMSFDAAYDERMTNNHGETGGTSAYWESAVADYYEKFLKGYHDLYRVTPITPTSGADSTADVNVVTIPAAARAVSYSVDGKEYKPGEQISVPAGGQIVVKAKVKEGWTLASAKENDGVAPNTEWTFKWRTQTVAPQEPVQNSDVLTIKPVTGVEYFYSYSKDGKDPQPFSNQTSIRVDDRSVWVVAKPAKGYQFIKDQKTVYGPYSYTAPNPPSNNGGNGNADNNGGGTTTPSATIVDVARFYNTRSGEHFYTSNPVEQNVLRANKAWRYEGVAFRMFSSKGAPVYRLYNRGGKHLFTTSETERDALIKAHWNYEGVAFYVPEGASVQVYRLYNPWNGDHLLTTSANERGVLVMRKLHDERVAFDSAK